MDINDCKDRIADLVKENFPGINLKSALFSQYNSLALVQFVVLLEEHFQISINNLDVHQTNFDNLDSVAKMVLKSLK